VTEKDNKGLGPYICKPAGNPAQYSALLFIEGNEIRIVGTLYVIVFHGKHFTERFQGTKDVQVDQEQLIEQA